MTLLGGLLTISELYFHGQKNVTLKSECTKEESLNCRTGFLDWGSMIYFHTIAVEALVWIIPNITLENANGWKQESAFRDNFTPLC